MSLFGKSKYTQQLEAGIRNQQETARQLEMSKKQQELTAEQQEEHKEYMRRHEESLKKTFQYQQLQDDVLGKALANAEREEKLLDMWESLATRMYVVVKTLEDKAT